jgi:tetratricopeptide (TPR) repeat protein
MGRSRPTHVADPKELGRRVHEARMDRGLSLRDVAFPGCSASFLSRVESGLRVPSTPVLIELASRLGVPPERLLGRRVDRRVADAAMDAAEVAARMGEPDADAALETLLEEARELGDVMSQSRLLECLGLLELDRRHDDRAIAFLEAALDCDVPTSPRERPAAHRALGRAYAGVGDLSRSVATLEAAFEAAAATPPDPSLMAQFGTYLANALTDQGRFADAERVLTAVLRHEQELNPTNALRLEWALARTYVEEGKPAIAETYTRRVLARLETAEERRLLGQAHLLLAGVLLDQRRSADALPHLDRSERLLAHEAPVELVRLSIERARVALAGGDLDTAERHAREALRRAEATEPGHAGTAYGILAEVELARGATDEARFLCQQALEAMEGTTSPGYVAHVYEVLAAVEEKAGNLEAALAALRARPAVWAEDAR